MQRDSGQDAGPRGPDQHLLSALHQRPLRCRAPRSRREAVWSLHPRPEVQGGLGVHGGSGRQRGREKRDTSKYTCTKKSFTGSCWRGPGAGGCVAYLACFACCRGNFAEACVLCAGVALPTETEAEAASSAEPLEQPLACCCCRCRCCCCCCCCCCSWESYGIVCFALPSYAMLCCAVLCGAVPWGS